MNVKELELGEIKLVGITEKICMPNNTIPQLWEKVMQRMHEIKNIIPGCSYGVAENMSDDFSFDETVGFSVSSFEDIQYGDYKQYKLLIHLYSHLYFIFLYLIHQHFLNNSLYILYRTLFHFTQLFNNS